ncbi:MAG: GH92 family glycosyl hydrolase [Verrucomicrobia bacterium]|nr:GH92 family glycosyl hydrolase [Verrucomicrobiota bacterium]
MKIDSILLASTGLLLCGCQFHSVSTAGAAAGGSASPVASSPAPKSLVSWVNPLMGTDSTREFSHGNLYPAVGVPFPMNTWSPYTQPQSDKFFYQYSQTQIRGIRQTHQPSPWIGDYAMFSLMPVSGKLVVNENDRASQFSHDREIAQPSYYSVYLDTWRVKAEVTPTERAARFRFAFDQPGDAYVVLDGFDQGASIQVIPAENTITGAVRYRCGEVPEIYSSNYFVIVFDHPFAASGVWSTNGIQPGVHRIAGKQAGAFVQFDASEDRAVGCKVASSFISPAQALQNLQSEIGDADFETIRRRAEARWNEALGRVQVRGGLDDQRRTFYSCLYRCLMFPHKFYEVDAQGKRVYFSPYDGQVHEGVLYTDSGFWDTFRAAQPLYNLLYPEVNAEILQGLLNAAEQSGWLPAWASPGHRNCMIGNHAFSLLADGWVKGVRSFDANRAVDAMIHDANQGGPIRSIGRDGAEYYQKLGYVPYSPVKGEISFKEATAKTLEYAYDDFCAAKLAAAIGRKTDAQNFLRSASNWTNVFDPNTGFVRERKADGSWVEPFYPNQWGGGFTEGCSWHWTWSVFQDLPGLITQMGGDDAFGAKLDEVFATANEVRPGTYGRMIHEMTEMVAADMGQYAHGNQPIQHMLYLYGYAGQPWKTQSRVRWAMGKLYAPTPDGYCGDEDNGQTSAWYVFSALGFYPVCPGDDLYIIGTPLFDEAVLKVGSGKAFTLIAANNGPLKPYIQGATLDGAVFEKTYLSHDQVIAGGELQFNMTSAPDSQWGGAPASRPPSALQRLIKSLPE